MGGTNSTVKPSPEDVRIGLGTTKVDTASRSCYHCDHPFSMCAGRQFCRRCGNVFCIKCTTSVNYINAHLPTRVCFKCRDVVTLLLLPLATYHHICSFLPNKDVNVLIGVCRKLQCSVQLPYPVVGGWKDLFGSAKYLAKGAFGKVYRTTLIENPGVPVAVKLIAKTKIFSLKKWCALVREIEAHSRCHHQNIINIYHVAQTVDAVYIVLEYADMGDLFDWASARRGQHVEEDARGIIRQLVEALRYMHEDVGVVHRDIKPENILMCMQHGNLAIKLADFGFAKFLGKYQISTVSTASGPRLSSTARPMNVTLPQPQDLVNATPCGTLGFAPPEVLENFTKTREKQVSVVVKELKAADMYSVGVVMTILLTGSEPFPAYVDTATHMRMARQGIDFSTVRWRHVSPEARELIKLLLSPNPDDRPMHHDVLAHPWLHRRASHYQNATSHQSNPSTTASSGTIAGRSTVLSRAAPIHGTQQQQQRRDSFDGNSVLEIRKQCARLVAQEAMLSRTVQRQLMSEWAVATSMPRHAIIGSMQGAISPPRPNAFNPGTSFPEGELLS
eukprot:PhM_4_TR8367/c0_g1_i1/m.14605/K08794/CAMK1; calcium/calmodulin-dependent protein kinase I